MIRVILAHPLARGRAKAAIDEPAKRCPDFDEECEDVIDHAHCAAGAVTIHGGELCITDPIDGFCPYVCGMMGKNV